jgi:hypothetical protein
VPERLVTIGTYSTAYEANLVKSELEAFEVDAVLADDNAIRLNWLWSNALGGVKVCVAESAMEGARRILQLEAGDGAGSPEPASVCPACGSPSSHCFLDKRGTFLSWLILGVPVIPVLARRVCDVCGRKRKA